MGEIEMVTSMSRIQDLIDEIRVQARTAYVVGDPDREREDVNDTEGGRIDIMRDNLAGILDSVRDLERCIKAGWASYVAKAQRDSDDLFGPAAERDGTAWKENRG